MVYISEDVLVASVFAFALPPVSSIGCCRLGRWCCIFRYVVPTNTKWLRQSPVGFRIRKLPCTM